MCHCDTPDVCAARIERPVTCSPNSHRYAYALYALYPDALAATAYANANNGRGHDHPHTTHGDTDADDGRWDDYALASNPDAHRYAVATGPT